MGLSFEQAIAAVAAPGQPFEVIQDTREGVTNRIFKNAPATMRDFFDLAREVDATFLVYEDEEWSFREVMEEVDALANALVGTYGVKVGDRVGIAMRNLPEWVVAFAAILSIGAVSVSLNAWWTEDEIDFAVKDSSLSVLIADTDRISRAQGPCQRESVAIIGVRLDELEPLGVNVKSWNDVVIRGVAMPVVALTPDDDATILYTSGTTGFPKGAVSTHRALCQTVLAFSSGAAIVEARRDAAEAGSGLAPCFILIVPLFHVTGCIPVMMSCFAWQFKLVMMHRWDPERALQLIERHRVTNFVGVPTQSWDLVECPNFARYDTSSLSSVGGGGSPAPPALVTRVENSFSRGRPSLAYGMTETNAYGPAIFADDYVGHPMSTGRTPTIVMDVDIRDDEMRSLAANQSGEVWLKSPTLVRGYWRRADDTARTIVDGWMRTGDLGRIDEEGFLYVVDRVKDMIIRAGENVYSAEVEAAIYDLACVHEAAVFAMPDVRLGEEVACVVMLKPGSTLDSGELRMFLAGKLANFMIPTRVAFTSDPLPRNAAGKFLKRDMPRRYFN